MHEREKEHFSISHVDHKDSEASWETYTDDLRNGQVAPEYTSQQVQISLSDI